MRSLPFPLFLFSFSPLSFPRESHCSSKSHASEINTAQSEAKRPAVIRSKRKEVQHDVCQHERAASFQMMTELEAQRSHHQYKLLHL
jgi:hypothetical protein